MGGVQFFLGRDKDNDKDSESDDDGPDLKQLRHSQQLGKKKKSEERQIEAAKAILKKVPFPPKKRSKVNGRKRERLKDDLLT